MVFPHAKKAISPSTLNTWFSQHQVGDLSLNPQQMVFLCLQTVVSYLPTTAEKSQGQKSPQKCYRIILLQMFTSVFSHVIVTFIGVLEIMEITSEEIKCQFLGRSTRIFLAVFSSIETQPDIYKTEVVANNMQGPITKACHCCFCFSKEIKKKRTGTKNVYENIVPVRHIFLKSFTFWQCDRDPILFHIAWRKTVIRSDERS